MDAQCYGSDLFSDLRDVAAGAAPVSSEIRGGFGQSSEELKARWDEMEPISKEEAWNPIYPRAPTTFLRRWLEPQGLQTTRLSRVMV